MRRRDGDKSVAQDDAFHNGHGSAWQLLLQFVQDRRAGSEHWLLERVAEALGRLGLRPAEVDRIGQAVLEALQETTQRRGMDWHTSHLTVRLWFSGRSTAATGTGSETREAGVQKRKGWGFFLLERQERASPDPQVESYRIIEVYLYQERPPAKKGRSP